MTQPEALQVLGLAVATSFDEGEPRAKTLLAACAPPRAGWQPSAAEVKACEALFAVLLPLHTLQVNGMLIAPRRKRDGDQDACSDTAQQDAFAALQYW